LKHRHCNKYFSFLYSDTQLSGGLLLVFQRNLLPLSMKVKDHKTTGPQLQHQASALIKDYLPLQPG